MAARQRGSLALVVLALATSAECYEHMKKCGLEDQDWRKGYWSK